jgi:hypothetical protein
MSSCRAGRLITLIAATVAAAALSPPITLAASAIGTKPPKPKVVTGRAVHVLVSSALLDGVVEPNGTPTSYYFQYGPTTAYGAQTPTVSVGSAPTKVKVGAPIVGLLRETIYHFRIVGLYVGSNGQNVLVTGRDHTFAVAVAVPKFELAKIPAVVLGTPFTLSGTLTGPGNAHHVVVLQATPYPYLEPFTSIGLPGATDAFGRFAFRVANFTTSTQFRVVTTDARPLYSRTITVPAAVRVTLRVRSSGHVGLVRIFGTVTPAAVGAKVEIQRLAATRPKVNLKGAEEPETTKYVTQFVGVVKKGNRSYSRFSLVVKVRRGGRYRAYIKLRGPGPVVSGPSTQTLVLHAAPNRKAKH